MAHTRAWNEASPAGSDLASTIDNSMRDMKADIRERMVLDHVWNSSTDHDGKHLKVTLRPADNVSVFVVEDASELTGSNAQPFFDLAQTWNTSGTPTFFKVSLTVTAAHADSLLMNFLVGGSSKFWLKRDGSIGVYGDVRNVNAGSGAACFSVAVTGDANDRLRILNTGAIWIGGGTNSQDISITRGSVGELLINPQADGGTIKFYSKNAHRWTLDVDGHLVPASDDAYDIGSSTYAPRYIYVNPGAVDNPAIRLQSDTDTGIYFNPTYKSMSYCTDGVTHTAFSRAADGAPVMGMASGSYGTGNGAMGCGISLPYNSDGNGAPGYICLYAKNAATYYIWPDSTGKLRIGTTPPSEGYGDTTGTIVGTQS